MQIKTQVNTLAFQSISMKTAAFLIACSFALFSCTKKEEAVQLTGKWKLTEQNNAYSNGGNNQWTTVTSSHIIQLNDDGTYEEEEQTQKEKGKYKIKPNNRLHFQSSANIKECSFQKLDPTILILSYKVREGEIMQKFIMQR